MALSVELDKLRESLSCCTHRGDQHAHVIIQEHDVSAKLKKVTLNAPSGDWFSFDPDKGRGKAALMSPLLAVGSLHSHHRACDCVVLVRRNGKLTALYIDLKSGNPVGYAGQFKSTRNFVRYALGLLEEFYGYKFSLEEERYVIFYGGKTPSIRKSTTAPRMKKMGHTQPNSPYKREIQNSSILYLKELLA